VSMSNKAKALLRRSLGPTAYKHYIRPLLIRRPQEPYAAKAYFESWHRVLPVDITDATTISPKARPLPTRYHYNAVENAIIEALTVTPLSPPLSVLDVGSGAGHWIDFYRAVVGADRLVGVELSQLATKQLRLKYASQETSIVCADVSALDFDLGERFDIVNAIGVMFHIVEDEPWRQSIRNLASHLTPRGVALIGGQFGWITRNVQFDQEAEVALVTKRIRSLRDWRKAARESGLRVVRVYRTRHNRRIVTPENNLLMLAPG
jgi:SAM-dependent methyltransferase